MATIRHLPDPYLYMTPRPNKRGVAGRRQLPRNERPPERIGVMLRIFAYYALLQENAAIDK